MTGGPSDRHGVFLTLDGPGGVGKSTAVAAAARLLAVHSGTRDRTVLTTREPTTTPLGDLARHGTEEYQGLTMACLIAADRYQHLHTQIRPALAAGAIVLCDRYIASSLVLQRIDGVPIETIWELNRHADRPDLSVLLTADPDGVAARLHDRGAHSRYERLPGSSRIECALYAEAATFMRAAGFRLLVLDATAPPPELAATITRKVSALIAEDR